jgi:hypothetical protein
LAKGMGEAIKEFKKTMSGAMESEPEREALTPPVAGTVAPAETLTAVAPGAPPAGTVSAPPAGGSTSDSSPHT